MLLKGRESALGHIWLFLQGIHDLEALQGMHLLVEGKVGELSLALRYYI